MKTWNRIKLKKLLKEINNMKDPDDKLRDHVITELIEFSTVSSLITLSPPTSSKGVCKQ